ncbi:MAG: methyltransferase [Patescibacteria group bacterium]
MEAQSLEANINPPKHKVRRILVHSHYVFFLLFLIGVTLDLIFQVSIFSSSILIPAGFTLLVFGTFVIIWTERTSHNFKQDSLDKHAFYSGPYRYTRNPTHFGLFLLVMGFGFIANAFFVVLTTLISFFIEKFIFQAKTEKMLEEKYGASYLEYKKVVKF